VILSAISFIVFGYLVGSTPTAYVFGRWIAKKRAATPAHSSACR